MAKACKPVVTSTGAYVPILTRVQKFNRAPLVIRRRIVTERELVNRPYKSVIFF